MARMFPPSIFAGTDSPGEKEVFGKLENDPITKDWIVLHSLDIAKHKRQISGEADFVIIVPQKGVLVLEVKACKSIRRENGLWYIGTKRPEKRGPFKQATQAMQSLKKQLWEKDRTLKKIVFWPAVIFPYISFDIESPEWHQWQAINAEQYESKSIGEIVLGVLNKAREFLANSPSAKWFELESIVPDEYQVVRIAKLLRPNFEFFESPASRAKRRQDELKQYTEEQYDALDAMESNPRVIFSGPAGTGKTLLAIELARRQSLSGRSVLLLCFNRLLGEWLQEETKTLYPQVKTSTIHSHMLTVAGISPQNRKDRFWDSTLPEQAIETLSRNNKSGYNYDVIIIDEAQDILTKINLDFLDASLHGGLSSGNIFFFGDFEKQVIYQNNPADTIRSKLSHIPIFSLRVNCRNTPRIAEFVHILGGLQPKYTRVRRPDNHIEPDIQLFANNQEQQTKLSQALEVLLKTDKYLGKDIIILSPHSDTKCIANQLAGKKEIALKSIYSLTSENQIAFCSIHSFKGLEAPVIILTDIGDIHTDQAKSLFYIAITRALDKLIIFVNEKARKAMLEVISSNT